MGVSGVLVEECGISMVGVRGDKVVRGVLGCGGGSD